VGYYPGCIDLLTRRPYRAGRQCQVGSLTVFIIRNKKYLKEWYFTFHFILNLLT